MNTQSLSHTYLVLDLIRLSGILDQVGVTGDMLVDIVVVCSNDANLPVFKLGGCENHVDCSLKRYCRV